MTSQKIKYGLLLSSLALLAMTVFFCARKKEALFSVPANFPQPVYRFEKNPLTEAGVQLGKTLFYDALLSKDNTISCGSCHQQSSGFTQHGHALSHGINDLLTKRNSMPLANLAWAGHFGWDGGVHDLDLFALVPIQNESEMDETLPTIFEKLRKSSTYPALFEQAFGSPEINTERFLKALSQFMLTMVSANSRYDKAMRNEGVLLTEAELAGRDLVQQKCGSCHPEPMFTDYSFRNNGLAKTANDDPGYYDITLQNVDRYKFKVPSLRNVAVTAPYMHDGRLETLEDVLAHYQSGIQHSETLDSLLNLNGKPGIALTPTEQTNILAFLKSLTDESFLQEQRFAEFDHSAHVRANATINAVETLMDLPLTNTQLKAAFTTILSDYLTLKNALVQDDGPKASQAAGRMLNGLANLDKTRLTEPQKVFFANVYDDLTFNTEHIYESKSAMHQRDHFGDVSKNLYVLLRSFRINRKPLHYLFCPNAGQKRGGYWISEPTDAGNPFLGRQGEQCDQMTSTTF